MTNKLKLFAKLDTKRHFSPATVACMFCSNTMDDDVGVMLGFVCVSCRIKGKKLNN